MTDDDFHKQKTIPDLAVKEVLPKNIPQKIGPYRIESLLNKGGMSYLYLGLHPGTSQPLAIKVLLPKYVKNKEMVGRFLKEAQIIGLTDHPNIIKLYGQGQWEKGLYIAMEFIRGISLRQFIQHKSLSHRRALEIVLQVAYALCHLHTHGVIHRDLKPENILITESGEVKVIDFGIAQLQGEEGEERITQRQRVIGTPIYMSPEQKENPQAVTYSSDIYSLGIIAYELILGRLSHGVIHLSLLPLALRKIIEKALKMNSKERYQDIVDFITDVSQYLKTLHEEISPREEEISEGMLDLIQETRAILIQKKSPKWRQVEVGIAVQEGVSSAGLYLDFFRLRENLYCVVLAEPMNASATSLFHLSMLRGMVRMSIDHFFQNGKKDQHPIKMLNALNRALHEDPKGEKFSLSLLMLNPEKDQLSFISCHHSPLWHIPEGAAKPRLLATPNPALGADPNASLLETADNWNSGDTLVLCTPNFSKTEDPNHLWPPEIALLSPQPQAEKLLHTASPANHASAILTIHRIF